MRWLDSVCEATNMKLTQLREAVEDRRAWHALVHGVTKSWTRLNDDSDREMNTWIEPQQGDFNLQGQEGKRSMTKGIISTYYCINKP